jgi:hypothetical protein
MICSLVSYCLALPDDLFGSITHTVLFWLLFMNHTEGVKESRTIKGLRNILSAALPTHCQACIQEPRKQSGGITARCPQVQLSGQLCHLWKDDSVRTHCLQWVLEKDTGKPHTPAMDTSGAVPKGRNGQLSTVLVADGAPPTEACPLSSRGMWHPWICSVFIPWTCWDGSYGIPVDYTLQWLALCPGI